MGRVYQRLRGVSNYVPNAYVNPGMKRKRDVCITYWAPELPLVVNLVLIRLKLELGFDRFPDETAE